MEFDVIKRAGLTQGEFAKLCGVSRVTANMWLNQKMKPHRLLRVAVAKRLEILDEAVAVGDLPLAKTVPRTDRERRIYTILTNTTLRIKARSVETAG